MSFDGAAAIGGVSLGKLKCAGELSVRVRRAAGWWGEVGKEAAAADDNAVPGRTAGIGETLNDLGNSTPSRGEPRWQQRQRLVGNDWWEWGRVVSAASRRILKSEYCYSSAPPEAAWGPNIVRWRRRRPTQRAGPRDGGDMLYGRCVDRGGRRRR